MNIFTTGYLSGILSTIPTVPSFFRTFFTKEVLSTKEEIYFDIKSSKARITPFVHPMSEGGIVEQTGYSTQIVKPAYLKDKRVFDSGKAIKRKAGEAIGGSLTPQQRMTAILQEEFEDAMNMFDRRIECMCAEALISGTQTVAGKGFNTSVNFGRAGGNAYSVSTLWSATNAGGEYIANIPGDLMDASLIISKAGGGTVRGVIMDAKAYKLFALNKAVQSRENNWVASGLRQSSIIDPKNLTEGEAIYMGNLGQFEIWVYNYEYINPVTGSAANVMPDNTVLLIGSNVQGEENYGIIMDTKAIETNQSSQRVFVKSWEEEDPGVRYVMLQSSPLMVPLRTNATVKLTVA